MSEIAERIRSVEPATRRRRTGRTGAADKVIDLHLRKPHMSKAAIARRVGCSPGNVDYVLKRYLAKNSEAQLREYQANQGDAFDAIGMRALASITPKKLANASAVQLMTTAAIATDKARLIRGEATGINVSVLLDIAAGIRERQSAPQPRAISGPTTVDAALPGSKQT